MSGLVLGDSNQLIASPGNHYNVEHYTDILELECSSWAANKKVEITILKLYNQCTLHLSSVVGDSPVAPAGSPGTINAVSASTYPEASTTGRIPNRFLPKHHPQDSTSGDGAWKTFPILGTNNGGGFVHQLSIYHVPIDDPQSVNNGAVVISYNASTSEFSHNDAGTEPTAITYLTDTNINVLT
jgi:hypothetical protein